MRVVYEPDTMEYRGEKYDCIYISFRDDDTNDSFTTTESDSVWYNQVTNQYRERHGIPYVDEIVALRERYGVSAAKMSLILGFGTNQYRMYEDGEVPSESNGKMIRTAANPRVFLDLVQGSRHLLSQKEYDKICSHVEDIIAHSNEYREEQYTLRRLYRTERGLANGFAPQSSLRLRNLLLYLLGQMGDTFQTKMNKVLFYLDFLSYRERGMAISGLAYKAIDFGPVPQRWDRVYSSFDEVDLVPCIVHEQESVALTARAVADMSAFTETERTIIDAVCTRLGTLTAHDISQLSHKEPAWERHLQQQETIPYTEAFSLTAI